MKKEGEKVGGMKKKSYFCSQEVKGDLLLIFY